ncbi:hypothetical protein HT031_005300 [Scenedesmus sp. PABB004]|nr:hypothetical protein HT031_005300 [Scenedesmus sp. PABB004]
MAIKAALLSVVALALVAAAAGQAYNPKKGAPVLIKPGQLAKLTWKPSPPHPDVVMCCGGALQLSWSPMDGGVVASVVLNVDDSCPNELQNQQYVEYIFQAAPKGIVTLDFKQNGDYYISCAVGEHCNAQGMQFLLAVRGCPQDNPTYTPVIPLNVQCAAPAAAGLNATAGGLGGGGLLGGLPGTVAPGGAGGAGAALPGAAAPRARSAAGVARRAGGLLAAALGGGAAAAAVLL